MINCVFFIMNRFTGCSFNIVFFFRFFKNIPDSGLSLFSLGVSVHTHTRKVENQRCRRTGRVQKKNTILNEHPVARSQI